MVIKQFVIVMYCTKKQCFYTCNIYGRMGFIVVTSLYRHSVTESLSRKFTFKPNNTNQNITIFTAKLTLGYLEFKLFRSVVRSSHCSLAWSGVKSVCGII